MTLILIRFSVSVMSSRTPTFIGCCVIGALTLAGCSSGGGDQTATSASASLAVAAAFYPVQFIAEQVGGEYVDVTTLTAPGVDAHDLELSPAAARQLSNTDAVLYLSGFQAAVDSAIESTGAHGIDAQGVIGEHGHDSGHEDDDHHGHNHAGEDPHFWLEPLLLAEYGHVVAAEFALLDPENAHGYETNAQQLEAQLTELDAEFEAGLAQCERTELFVGHEAFGYLSERYGLSQHGLAGLDPETEPSPARVREVRQAIEDSGATTIFSESTVGAAAIESLAADAGVQTAVLDPIEGVLDEDDYIEVMNRNLQALRAGLDCA